MGISFLYNILSFEFFGNQIWTFLAFFLILFISYPLSKLLLYVLENYIKKFTEHTQMKLDDIIFKSINPPISMFIFAILFYFASAYFVGIIADIASKIFNFLIVIPIVYFMIKFSTEMIGYYLKGERARLRKINEAAIDLLMQIIRISLFFVGILLILSNLGYDISALIAGLGVGGLAFALAAQDILKNFFAGIALIFDKTFGKGERVNFEGNSGVIEELKLRSTKIRTYDGTVLTIPNAKLADNIVENVTKVPRVKVKMTLGVVYNTSSKKLKQAKDIIQKAIDSQEDADGESTTIFFDNFGAYSLDIKVYYYAKILNMDDWKPRVNMKDEVNFAIKDGFEKAGIEFAFPTQTIELQK